MAKIEQVGGAHYSDSEGVCPNCGHAIQHWDWASKLPYLAGAATKYIARFLSKDGFQGLEKAISYIRKMMAVYYPKEYEALLERELAEAEPEIRKRFQNSAVRLTYPEFTPDRPGGLNCVVCDSSLSGHAAKYPCPQAKVPAQPWPVFRGKPGGDCELCGHHKSNHFGPSSQCFTRDADALPIQGCFSCGAPPNELHSLTCRA